MIPPLYAVVTASLLLGGAAGFGDVTAYLSGERSGQARIADIMLRPVDSERERAALADFNPLWFAAKSRDLSESDSKGVVLPILARGWGAVPELIALFDDAMPTVVPRLVDPVSPAVSNSPEPQRASDTLTRGELSRWLLRLAVPGKELGSGSGAADASKAVEPWCAARADWYPDELLEEYLGSGTSRQRYHAFAMAVASDDLATQAALQQYLLKPLQHLMPHRRFEYLVHCAACHKGAIDAPTLEAAEVFREWKMEFPDWASWFDAKITALEKLPSSKHPHHEEAPDLVSRPGTPDMERNR